MILGFEHFNPIDGEYPSTFPEVGSDIVYRAREILKFRTKDEIQEAANVINWLIDKSPARDEVWDQLIADANRIDNDPENSQEYIEPKSKQNLHAPTYMLAQCKNVIQLIDHPSLPNLSWPELFAALSLTLIDQAIDEEKYYASWHKDEDNKWLHEWRIISHASHWIIEAMNAVATAEGMRFSELQATISKRKLSDRNTLAAIQRHSKTNNALLSLQKFYRENSTWSMRKVAQIFCERFPDQVSHLAHYNRVRTLSEGLSKLMKGQRQSIQLS